MNYTLHLGNCLDTLRGMADNSVDSIVTDPPYGLSFMGKKWDYDVPGVDVWAECLRVLKPGGHLLAFAGTRTQHRMAVRIEDAGFEIRDMIAWVYGCLDEATEIATSKGVMPYHKTKIGDLVLCYDVEHGQYTYQPILEIVEYDYSDTAYRLVGDFGEQVVSRNHRVIVERGGSEAFQIAETLECEARVPVLESLPALRQAIHDAHQGAGRPQQDVQRDLCECVDRRSECRGDSAVSAQGQDDQVRGLRDECLETGGVASQGGGADMQQALQRGLTRRGVGYSRAQGASQLDNRVGGGAEGANDWRIEPGLEGRADLSQPEGCVCGSTDQVRALPGTDVADGAVGRLRDGASTCSGTEDQPTAYASGVRSSHQPQRDGQQTGEPDAVCHERTAQGVRAWSGHRSAMVRVVPFHYTGKVWCLRVPTGAFVAVRNGVAFPTGNSGFPKSLDVSKAIDKAAGVEREVLCTVDPRSAFDGRERTSAAVNTNWRGAEGREDVRDLSKKEITAPATEAARKWQGWGTALKPALEPITVARKPLVGTVAANVLEHGTGAINIDGCRVGTDVVEAGRAGRGECESSAFGKKLNDGGAGVSIGRWPANLIHDGSDEVLAGFPVTGASKASMRGIGLTDAAEKVYGNGNPDFDSVRGHNDNGGSAARFFYCAKASKRDRDEGLEGFEAKRGGSETFSPKQRDGNGADRQPFHANIHPTVKPTDLMRYLCRLVTPPGGVVLDPFMGSGSTGKAAMLEGFQFVGCELSPEYLEIARARIEAARTRADETSGPKPVQKPKPKPQPVAQGQNDLFEAAA